MWTFHLPLLLCFLNSAKLLCQFYAMRLFSVVVLATLAIGTDGINPPPAQKPISWQHSAARALPVVQNFLGSSNLRPDGVSLGPITLGGINGNFYNSSLNLDGSPFELEELIWSSCSGVRKGTAASGVNVQVTTRMPVDERVIMQNIEVSQAMNIEVTFDGPFFRSCDNVGGAGGGCGWGLILPTDNQNFELSLSQLEDGTDVMIVADTTTNTVSASALATPCPVSIAIDGTSFSGSLDSCSSDENISLQHVIAVAEKAVDAIVLLTQHLSDFEGSFESACSDWEERWRSAYDPADDYFSGHLPTLETGDASLADLYTWAANAQVSLMRTSMLSSPRQYIISEGASNSYGGSLGMGGSGQFIWDLSFSAATLSLLDPDVALDILKHVVSNADFGTYPIGVPQAWDGFPAYPNIVDAGQYAFDFIASFIYLQSYFTLTGDLESLTTPLQNNHDESQTYSPLDFMRRIASNYVDYPKAVDSEFLADYGSDKRSFLEAAPTYTNVIAGLQIGNAGMQFSLAKLLESIGGHDDEVDELRSNATSIVEDVVKLQFREGGFFACLNSTAGQDPVDILALADHIYIGQGLGLIGDSIDLLPSDVRNSMAKLFFSDYLVNGWVAAVSENDESMANLGCDPNLCTDLDKVSMRSDWTATGGYGGLFGASIEALADIEGGLDGAIKALKTGAVLASASDGTMPSQGIAVRSTPMFNSYLGITEEDVPKYAFAPAFPEFFDKNEQQSGFPSEWPNTARSIQNAEASIVDCFIRTVFGWRPSWSSWDSAADKDSVIDAAIWKKGTSRGGFEGKLYNVKTPFGDINLEVSNDGVSWTWAGETKI